LDHRHIIKHIESYDDAKYMYLVMELMPDAIELQDLIDIKIKEAPSTDTMLYSEKEVRHLMHMILSGIMHVHANGVVHRDLKP